MDLVDALSAIARRWLVLVVGLVGLVAIGSFLTRDVPTHYQSTGQVLLLLPPGSTGAATPTSPFLNAPAGLTTAASVIATEVSTLDTERDLAAAGHDAKYSASVLPGTGPLVVVTATGTDPRDVVATRDDVMARLARELQQIQDEADVPENQLIYPSTSSVDKGAEVMPGSRKRALIGIAGSGLLLLLLVLAAVDRLGTVLAGRRRALTAPPAALAAPAAPAVAGPPAERPSADRLVPDGVGSR